MTLSPEMHAENQTILTLTLDAAKDLFATLAVVSTFLGGSEATIIGVMLTSSTQKNPPSKVAIVLAYLALVSSMLVAMLSALHGVFCAREKLLVPYELRITEHSVFLHSVHIPRPGASWLHSNSRRMTRTRDAASTTIAIFLRVEAAASSLVAILAISIASAIASILIFVWAAHDRATSVAVTIVVGLLIAIIILNRDTLVALPRSFTPPGMPASVTETSKSTLSGIQRTVEFNFFSAAAKPALHKVESDEIRTLADRGIREAHVTVEVPGAISVELEASVSKTREEIVHVDHDA